MAMRGRRAGYGAVELLLLLSSRIKTLPPIVEFALICAAILLGAYWIYWEAERAWFNESLRKSPGIGAHFVFSLQTGDLERRQYILDLRNQAGAGAAFYLSAVGKPTFVITDTMGEKYPLEASTGFDGLPFGHWVYVSAEAVLRPKKTYLRITVNRRVIAERCLPFAVTLGDDNWSTALGSDLAGRNGAKFVIGSLLWRAPTLGVVERRKLRRYFERKFNIDD